MSKTNGNITNNQAVKPSRKTDKTTGYLFAGLGAFNALTGMFNFFTANYTYTLLGLATASLCGLVAASEGIAGDMLQQKSDIILKSLKNKASKTINAVTNTFNKFAGADKNKYSLISVLPLPAMVTWFGAAYDKTDGMISHPLSATPHAITYMLLAGASHLALTRKVLPMFSEPDKPTDGRDLMMYYAFPMLALQPLITHLLTGNLAAAAINLIPVGAAAVAISTVVYGTEEEKEIKERESTSETKQTLSLK